MVLGSVFLAVLAIFLPPLAVFMRTASCGKMFLNLLLTCLGFIPGIIRQYSPQTLACLLTLTDALHVVSQSSRGRETVYVYEKPKHRRWYVAPMSAGAAAGGGC
jgi:uncharacterized membrane protein YqaE (UPF0057 family)